MVLESHCVMKQPSQFCRDTFAITSWFAQRSTTSDKQSMLICTGVITVISLLSFGDVFLPSFFPYFRATREEIICLHIF